MSVCRLLLFCLAGLIVHQFRAESAVPAHDAERDNPGPAAESSITFSSVHVDGPYIAMTFDDGPSTTLTPKLLDLLAAHHIKATFFPRLLRGLPGKATKLETTAGRIPTSLRCRKKPFAANCGELTTQLKALPVFARLCSGRLMDRSRHAKNVGSMMNSDIRSFFGTWIRMTGSGPVRLWFALAFLKRLGLARSCCLTIFTREQSKPCLLPSMRSKRRDSNSLPYRS